jgi:ribosomal protein S12 methylthiotransferase accessory factor
MVTLIHAPSRMPSLHTFWAAIIEPQAFAPSTRVVAGSGTHLSPEVAASRALTEAAQGRLGLIHASREDVTALYVERFPGWMLDMFAPRPGGANWRDLEDRSSDDLRVDLDRVLGELQHAGMEHVFRVDMTRPELDIAVVRVIVPGLSLDKRLLHHQPGR